MSCCCKSGRVRQIFAGVTGGICLLIVGSWTGWISPFLHKMESGEEVQFNLTISEKSWVVSIPDLMHLIVSIPGGYVMEFLGRKPVFLITALFYQLSGILAVFGTSVTYLYLSRMACGIASALTYMVVPMYLAEIAETEIRGATSALFTVLLWGGTLLSNTLALFFTIKTLEIILSIMPLIFTVLVICFLPESPYYHLTKDNNKKAHKSLAGLRDEKDKKGSSNVSEIQRELDEMYAQVRKEMEYRSRWMDLVSTKGTRRATLVVMTISVMQRFTGINVMLAYMAIELPSGGGGLSPDECVIMFGLLLMVTSLGSMLIIDRLGRKPALYASGIVCSILQGVIAYYYYSKKLPDHDISHIKWIPYVCMLLFAVFYQAGIGIISHTLLGEMFPANVKNKAAAATNIVFSISSFIILKTFPIISKTYGAESMFIIFAISNALSAVFTYFFVVETKGKTLGEIQEILNR